MFGALAQLRAPALETASMRGGVSVVDTPAGGGAVSFVCDAAGSLRGAPQADDITCVALRYLGLQK